MKTHLMGEMTVKDIEEYLQHNQTIILPYGVVEQHGHHLPLDTDIRLGNALSLKFAEALDCIVAPSMNYCFSGGMLKGTINIKPNTFSNMMGEIIESLALQGFKNIIIVPGHCGSESLYHLKESLRILKWLNPALSDIFILFAVITNYSESVHKMFEERDYHAGMSETSQLLAISPEVVRKDIVMDKDEIAELLRNNPDSYQKRVAFTNSTDEIVQTSQSKAVKIGVMGYPEKATAELGEKIFAEFVFNAKNKIGKMLEEVEEKRKSGERVEFATPEELRILNL